MSIDLATSTNQNPDVFQAPAPTSPKALTGLAKSLADMVTTAVPVMFAQSPRNRQIALGPSEIGVECDLRIAYGALAWPKCGAGIDPLPAIVGTAAHAWLADQFRVLDTVLGPGRFLVEHRVTMPGSNISGSVDLYDRERRTACDWKFKGADGIRDARANGPGQQYRVQAHLYAYGLRAAGEQVEHVAVVYFSRGGWLRDLHVWTEPYSEAVAQLALERLSAITVRAASADPPPFDAISRTPNGACGFCAYHKPRSDDLQVGCPGGTTPVPTPPPPLL